MLEPIFKIKIRSEAQSILDKIKELFRQIILRFKIELLEYQLAALGRLDFKSTRYKRAISKFQSDEKYNSLEDFEKIYNAQAGPKRKWKLYFPLYIKLPKRKFVILNKKYWIESDPKKSVFNKVDYKHELLKGGIQDLSDHEIPMKYICTEVYADSPFTAFESIQDSFNLLRGIIDFSLLSNSVSFQSGLMQRTLNPHPRFFLVVGSDETKLYTFLIHKSKRFLKVNFKDTQKKLFNKLCILFTKKPAKSSLESILANAMRLYGQSMETFVNYTCFLSLWQLAEEITLSYSFGGKTKLIITRLTTYSKNYSLFGIDISESLSIIREKRNDLVHRGNNIVDDVEVNILQSICDASVIWLLENRHWLKTKQHLIRFHELVDANDRNKVKDVLNFLK